jgi:hypothetical protein
MKILLLVTFLFPTFLFAQSWYPVKSTDSRYYELTNPQTGDFTGIGFDNIIPSGSDTILIGFNMIREDSINAQCDYTTVGDHWLGQQIIVKSDASVQFINAWDDTLFIYPDAHINDQTVFLKFPDNTEFRTTVITEDTLTVLGQPDSIKVFEIWKYDAAGAPEFHVQNGQTFTIGKQAGIVKCFTLLDFPNNDWQNFELVGDDNPRKGVYMLTNGEVFDFEVGDVFHYWGGQMEVQFLDQIYSTWIERTITGKVLTGDSVTYTIDEFHVQRNYMPPDTIVTNTTYQETYHISDRFLADYPSDSRYQIETDYVLLYTTDFNFNRRKVHQHPPSLMVDYFSSECLIIGMGWLQIYKDHVEGLGRTYSAVWTGSYETTEQLLYFQKGTETWGSPIDFGVLLGVEEHHIGALLTVNPIGEGKYQMTNSTKKVLTAEIYNTAGQRVDAFKVPVGESQLDLQRFGKGVYLLQVNDGVNSSAIKLIH